MPILLGSAFLLLLVFLLLLFELLVTCCSFLFRFSCRRRCHLRRCVSGLCCGSAGIVNWAVVVCANGYVRGYPLAINDDGWFGCFAGAYWFCIGVFDCSLDLAEDATLDGSGRCSFAFLQPFSI